MPSESAKITPITSLADPTPTLPQAAPCVSFEDFWALYPRHEAKKDARRAWSKISAGEHIAILSALIWQRKAWSDREARFILLPASYLNGERWTDEPPATVQGALTAAHIPFQPEAKNAPRTAMPAHVAEALAKLRGGQRG